MYKVRGSDVAHDEALTPAKDDLRVPLSLKRKKSLRGFRCAGEVHLEASAWVEEVRED
jgi:hypothetical protein